MTRLYLTRHGQTEWNIVHRMQGQQDSPLTELGKKQAKWLGDRLHDVGLDVIFSSSSGRAIRTAEIIRGTRKIPVILSDNLREISLGAWEGMLHTEVERIYPEEHRNFWHFPHQYQPVAGGETFAQLYSRVSNEVEKIISNYTGKNILIVAHATVLKMLMAYFENKGLKDLWTGPFMKSTCLNLVEIENGHREVIFEGDISHYQE
ncbi:MAG: histidine phosphatase family protein [Firmicutes bacterium]|nr:histidine phosphatase family protein [Bacillota bacterium]